MEAAFAPIQARPRESPPATRMSGRVDAHFSEEIAAAVAQAIAAFRHNQRRPRDERVVDFDSSRPARWS